MQGADTVAQRHGATTANDSKKELPFLPKPFGYFALGQDPSVQAFDKTYEVHSRDNDSYGGTRLHMDESKLSSALEINPLRKVSFQGVNMQRALDRHFTKHERVVETQSRSKLDVPSSKQSTRDSRITIQASNRYATIEQAGER